MKIEFGVRFRIRKEPQIIQVIDQDGTVTEIESDTEVAVPVGFSPNEVDDDEG